MSVLRLRVILLLFLSVVVIIMFANARPNWAHQQVPGFFASFIRFKISISTRLFFFNAYLFGCVCALIDCKFTTLALFCCVCECCLSQCVFVWVCFRGNTSRKLNARKRLHDTLGLQISFVYIFILVCVCVNFSLV